MNRTQKPFISLLVATLAMGILPDASANDHYNSSRSPLIESPFVRLPLGSVTANGWLEQQLILQKDGLTGHAEELYSDIGTSQWIGGTSDGWERGPYYAKGLIPLAYILNDPGLITKAQKWIDEVISSQRPNGDFGPRDQNWWPNMIVMYYMRDYYEATNDARIIPFMTNYFQFQSTALPSHSLSQESVWAKARGGDNIDTVLWLYNETGDPDLLTLADLLDEQTNDWTSYYADGTGDNGYPQHIVNNNQGLKRPALWYLRSHDAADRDAFMNATGNDGWLMQTCGRIDAMWNGTEPLTDLGSTQGTELCAIVERILSNSIALRVLGTPAIGDQMEKVAYNALPGDLKHDIKGLRYYSLVNAPKNSNEILGFQQNGNGQNSTCPSPHSGYGCCRSNFHFGWPKFVQHMWMATSDNGLAVAAYGPSQVTATVGAGTGTQVTIDQVTDYPFRDTITLTVSTSSSVSFPLKLRIPGWCDNAEIKVNGTTETGVTSDSYHTIDRLWSDGDTASITFPMEIKSSVWINNSIGLERGPLVYSLLIQESWTQTGDWIGGLFKQEEINPASPWNYGLTIADLDNPGADITVVESAMPTQPFKASDAPVKLVLNAKKVLTWGDFRKHRPGIATELPLSPLVSNEPIEEVTLVPFGSTEIRTTYFPYVGNDDDSRFNFPISAKAEYGGSISPFGTEIFQPGADKTYTISTLSGCTIKSVIVDGVDVGAVSSYTFTDLSREPHTIIAKFNVTVSNGSIPRPADILLALDPDDLPDSGVIDSWATAVPAGDTLVKIETPEVEIIDGKKCVDNSYYEMDGFRYKQYFESIPCTGASVIAVVKPIHGDPTPAWTSIVDVFYDRLVLGMQLNTNKVVIRRNGSWKSSDVVIPDDKTTLLSLIVQPTGQCKVYADGVEIISDNSTSDMTALVPFSNGHDFTSFINIGRNNPDGWSAFNGKIGDVFLYKTALTDPERQELEAYLVNRLITTDPTLTITGTSYAGPGTPFIINFKGAADTAYTVETSADLQDDFIPIAGLTATTDEFGVGTAIVPAAEVGSGKYFLRIAE